MIIFIHMYMNVDRISTISLPYIFESFYGTINTLFWPCRKFYDIYLIETGAIVIDITAHGDESSRRVDVEQARSLVITNNWVSHNIEWRLEETESIQPCTKTSRQIRRNNSVCYFHIHVFKNLQTYKVVSICGSDRDDGSTATNRRGDGPGVGLVLEGGWELITPYIDGHRNGCTLQLGNTIIPSKCIILYKRKKMLLLLHK